MLTRVATPYRSRRPAVRRGLLLRTEPFAAGSRHEHSVLYDAQGPRAKQRNILYTVLFLLAAAAVVW
ncbi:hypothetical protein ACWC5G_10365, partial [Streptomyces sp. NPDC001274]